MNNREKGQRRDRRYEDVNTIEKREPKRRRRINTHILGQREQYIGNNQKLRLKHDNKKKMRHAHDSGRFSVHDTITLANHTLTNIYDNTNT